MNTELSISTGASVISTRMVRRMKKTLLIVVCLMLFAMVVCPAIANGGYECEDDYDCSDSYSDDCSIPICQGGYCEYRPADTGTPCGDKSPLGECDEGDTCDGYGYCDPNLKYGSWSDTTPSDCYNAVCTGSSVDCNQDLAPEDTGTPCGYTSPLGECDEGDTCDGHGYCEPNLKYGLCTDDTPYDCYNAVCTGSSVNCFQDLAPEDTGTPCGYTSPLGECDEGDTCDGHGYCEPNLKYGSCT